jgi:hypothetical protein
VLEALAKVEAAEIGDRDGRRDSFDDPKARLLAAG